MMEDINEEASVSVCSSTGDQFDLEMDVSKTEDPNDVEEQKQKKEIQNATTRTWVISLLLLMMGAGASCAFLFMGITGAQEDQQQNFERRASDFSKEIDATWSDYEGAARWAHSECRNFRTDNFTYEDFEAVYHYLIDGGLEFFSIDWIPNITHAERAQVEQEQGSWWKENIPGAENYIGFTGQEPDPDIPGGLMYANRSDQPFYYPIYFVEPKSAAASIIHYDLYSPPWEQSAIDQAIRTHEPALTGRFVLAQHTEDDGYSTILYHPGTKLPSHFPNNDRNDMSLIVMLINPFLTRVARFQTEPLSVYLYDKTGTTMDNELAPEFLGGVQVTYDKQNSKTGDRQVVLLKETNHSALQDYELYYEREILVGGRTWTTVVVAEPGSYAQDTLFVILAGCMIFAASLLLAYIWVKHNQHRTDQVMKIVSKAAAESKIVSNLYPAAVRKEMIEQQRESDASAKNNHKDQHATNKDAFKNIGGSEEFNMFRQDGFHNLEKTSEGIYKTKPLADRYEATTIMFADLAGFTAWSSKRTPEDVFTLLESLYGAFDNIAKRRRVFKVETIGDCYVAVAGLPKPRADHAVVMCRFANDCLHKMQKLTRTLSHDLGEDTNDLCFRVGLHSGPVTAGVLRGDKGRFQLFGDTMNTASRMETTGVKNKIQVSQDTADLLLQSGHQKWLTPREDAVVAKGKGEVNTFFVAIVVGSTASYLTESTGPESGEMGCSTASYLTETTSTEGEPEATARTSLGRSAEEQNQELGQVVRNEQDKSITGIVFI